MITYLSVEWKKQCKQQSGSAILIVDGKKKRVTYAELSMRGDVLKQQDGPLQAGASAEFFSFLAEVVSQWEGMADYSVSPYEDIWWKIKIRETSRRIYRITGTSVYPPCGAIIERKILALCEEAGIHVAYK